MLALTGAALHAQAGAPSSLSTGWVRESWSIADGLPVNSINAIIQDRRGYIWAATFDGLVRFDSQTGTKEEHKFGSGRWGSEAPFAPRDGSTGETDGYLVGYDVRNGQELWRFQTGAGVHTAPITYSVDGEQYVAVFAGKCWVLVLVMMWVRWSLPRLRIDQVMTERARNAPAAAVRGTRRYRAIAKTQRRDRAR